MSIKIRQHDGQFVSMDEAWNKNAGAVRYQGHVYIVIRKGNSQHTEFGYHNGFHPVLNLKSRTIRAIPVNEPVEMLDLEVDVYSADQSQ